MLVDSRLDVHGLECHAVGLRQFLGVALGARGRAEARHRDREDALAVEREHIKCVDEDDEGEGGIQTARQADDRRFCVRVAQTGRQTGRLKRQNLLAALVAQRLVCRNERGARERAVSKVVLCRREREREYTALDRFKGIHALTLVREALKVNVGVDDALLEHAALREHGAVLGNEVVTGEDKVLRGFTEAGVRIQVGAQQSAGLLTHEVAAVARLADDFIGSRQVDDNVRAHLRQCSRRRIRHPQILADLYAEGEQRLLVALKNGIGDERNPARLAVRGLDQHVFHTAERVGRDKMALLVELRVVRNVRFRDERQYIACVHDSCDVVQLALDAQRQTDDDDGGNLFAFAADGFERLQRALEQRFLQKQVAAGVAGQAQLGEGDELRALCGGLLRLLHDLRSVIFAVRNVKIGRRGGDFDKSISHIRISSRCSDSTSIPFFAL